ncbi:CoA transferase [Mesorhizobium sp. M0999]|uniref:CoA transferase n=1 Tax=Mesorhizobium sp. M0999 TaxID=2957045 RepID=UPI00333BEDD3
MIGSPHEGVKVLGLTEHYPGPHATALPADLGADIALIKRPWVGDPARKVESLFTSLRRNIDVLFWIWSRLAGKKNLSQLSATADVLVEGCRPGVMHKFACHRDRFQQAGHREQLAATSPASRQRHGKAVSRLPKSLGMCMTFTTSQGIHSYAHEAYLSKSSLNIGGEWHVYQPLRFDRRETGINLTARGRVSTLENFYLATMDRSEETST